MEKDNKPDVDIRILIHDVSDPNDEKSDIYEVKGSGYYVLATLTSIIFQVFMKADTDIEDAKRITCDNFDKWYDMYKDSKD